MAVRTPSSEDMAVIQEEGEQQVQTDDEDDSMQMETEEDASSGPAETEKPRAMRQENDGESVDVRSGTAGSDEKEERHDHRQQQITMQLVEIAHGSSGFSEISGIADGDDACITGMGTASESGTDSEPNEVQQMVKTESIMAGDECGIVGGDEDSETKYACDNDDGEYEVSDTSSEDSMAWVNDF